MNKYSKEARSYISAHTVLVIVFTEVTSSVTRGESSDDQKSIIGMKSWKDRTASSFFSYQQKHETGK